MDSGGLGLNVVPRDHGEIARTVDAGADVLLVAMGIVIVGIPNDAVFLTGSQGGEPNIVARLQLSSRAF